VEQGRSPVFSDYLSKLFNCIGLDVYGRKEFFSFIMKECPAKQPLKQEVAGQRGQNWATMKRCPPNPASVGVAAAGSGSNRRWLPASRRWRQTPQAIAPVRSRHAHVHGRFGLQFLAHRQLPLGGDPQTSFGSYFAVLQETVRYVAEFTPTLRDQAFTDLMPRSTTRQPEEMPPMRRPARIDLPPR
jgi:hypothetical protein